MTTSEYVCFVTMVLAKELERGQIGDHDGVSGPFGDGYALDGVFLLEQLLQPRLTHVLTFRVRAKSRFSKKSILAVFFRQIPMFSLLEQQLTEKLSFVDVFLTADWFMKLIDQS